MRPKTVYQSTATGSGTWVPLDYLQTPFGVSFRATVSDGGSMTYKVQHGLTDPDREHPFVGITRSTTTATITFPSGYTFQTGDSLYITGAGAPLDGWYDIASVSSATVATYTVANSGTATSASGARALIVHVGDHVTATGKTASYDSNYAFPILYIRSNITTFSSGTLALTVIQSN